MFLKRVREGPSDNSYGIHVAKLAGLPNETIAAAERILASLNAAAAAEGQGQGAAGAAPTPVAPSGDGSAEGGQPLLFDAAELVVRELRGLRIDAITPLDALNRIARWKGELGSDGDET